MRDDDGAPEPTPEDRPQTGRYMGKAKLTDDDVREIRADYAAGKWTQADLAHIYAVSKGVIDGVVNYRSYTHVKPQPEEKD